MVRLGIVILRWLLFATQRLLNLLTWGNWPSAVATCAIITDEQGRLLLLERADGAGLGLPGGFIRQRERVEEAIRREVLEETGIEVRIVRCLGHLSGPRHPGVACVDVVYHCVPVAESPPEPKTGLEGAAGWHRYEEVRGRIAYDYAEIVEPFLAEASVDDATGPI
ncbi:MAG: NUDIX domain-containing protein [Phycisphaerales bacterium JB038]